MSKSIVDKLLDWECQTANEESETLLDAVMLIDKQQAQLRTLAEAVLEISEMLTDWSVYADDYFAHKYGLQKDLDKAEKFCVLAREILEADK